MENLYHHIESYLLNELPAPERAVFEQALQQDSELARATEAHRELIRRMEAARLRGVVQSALQDQSIKPAGRLRWWWWLLITGGISFMVFMFFPKQPKTVIPATPKENLTEEPIAEAPRDTPVSVPVQSGLSVRQWASLAQKHQVKPSSTTLRTSNPDHPAEKTVLGKAQEAYFQGRFQETLKMLQDVPADEDVRYFRANALFKLHRFTEAEKEFKALESSFQYQHEARWNRFLCSLGTGKVGQEKARKQALAMANDENFELHEFAAELAEELREK